MFASSENAALGGRGYVPASERAVRCEEIARQASRFIDGDLPLDESRAVHAHLDGCGDCRRYIEQIRQIARRFKPAGASIDDDAAKAVARDVLARARRKDNDE